jgi:hypothetical protein
VPAQTQSLIDKLDNSEILRDEIAAILFLESEKQQELALLANKDPDLWKLRVFVEASAPWAEWADAPDSSSPLEDTSPIINVKFDSETFDASKGNIAERQQAAGTFHIDCYGYGKASSSGAGHEPGDRAAALEAQRAVRLVRNILMSSYWAYLGHRGVVGRRWIQSIQIFQPELGGRAVQHVMGARVLFAVDFNEFSPQYQGVPLALVSVEVQRSGTNQVLLVADVPIPS